MKKQITSLYLKEILDYNPKTGDFIWKNRPIDHFNTEKGFKTFNTRFSGKNAGCIVNGYVVIRINNNLYKAHRLAWLYTHGNWPQDQIDHINGDRKDNRIENLRQCSMSQNQWNEKLSINNASGYKGVRFHKASNKYGAQIGHNNKQIHLGLYTTPEEAHAAYCAKAAELFGEYANFGT
jgi:hypothetical protein